MPRTSKAAGKPANNVIEFPIKPPIQLEQKPPMEYWMREAVVDYLLDNNKSSEGVTVANVNQSLGSIQKDDLVILSSVAVPDLLSYVVTENDTVAQYKFGMAFKLVVTHVIKKIS